MARSVELFEYSLPLQSPFRTAAATIDSRRGVLVAVTADGVTGWGEAAPFPGFSTESLDDVWDALAQFPHGDGSLPATAAAALAEADADRKSRAAGEPLWQGWGGAARPIPASQAVGIHDLDPLLEIVGRVVATGVACIKLKIGPGHDKQPVRAVRETFPELAVAVDANASYRDPDDPLWPALDDMGLSYVEQPLAATDLAGHAAMRRRMQTPLCLDESAPTESGVTAVLAAGAADMLCLKPGLVGLPAALRIYRQARAAGVAVKPSGLVETSLGKAFTVALGSLPGVSDADLIPAAHQLAADVVADPWELDAGGITPRSSPGSGVEVDRDLVAAVTRRVTVVPL